MLNDFWSVIHGKPRKVGILHVTIIVNSTVNMISDKWEYKIECFSTIMREILFFTKQYLNVTSTPVIFFFQKTEYFKNRSNKVFNKNRCWKN